MQAHKLLLALLFVSTSATAAFRDGNKLLSEINSSTLDDKIYAMGYIAGVSDATYSATHCAPGNVTLSQIMDMTRDYLTRNASIRNLPADILISTMLTDRWPCPKKDKGTKL
jgi:hypothetical protein